MAGFDLSTGSIDLINQPGDIPLDGGDSGPACNHQCPHCCRPATPDKPLSFAGFMLIMFLFMAGVMGLVAVMVYLTGPQY